MIAEELLF